jgi:chromosome segregation ATPase
MSRSASLSKSGLEELTNLELQGKALQDRISLLMVENTGSSPERSGSASSSNVNSADDRLLELQMRFDALEAENDRLTSEKEKLDASKQVDLALKLDKERTRTAEMTNLVKDKNELLKVHEATLADLEELRRMQQISQQQISELEKRLAEQLEESQQTSEALNKELADAVTAHQKLEQETQILQAAKADIKIQNDELGVQVDELRLAGQVRSFHSVRLAIISYSFLGNNSSVRGEAQHR